MPVLGFYLLEVEESLVCTFFHLDNFDFAEGFLVDLKALEFGVDFSQGGAEYLLFLTCLSQRHLHLGHLLVELHSPAHFFQYSQEAALSFDHQVLDLALLDDLELGVAA